MLRITPLTLHSKQGHIVPDCATGGDSTSGGAFAGAIIDRLALGFTYTHAQPVLIGQLPGTTSTAGGRYVVAKATLRHGDSSGGGDLTDYLTGLDAAAVVHYTTQGESTDWKSFTTGNVRVQASAKCYPLQAAKRFIAPVGTVTRVGLTTATAAANLVTATLALTMLNQDQEISVEYGVNPGSLGTGNTWKTTSTAT